MTTIDKLIFDALAGRHSVALPGEGTLEVRRRGARKISETRIVPPQNVVVFTPGGEEGTRNIIALVADDRGGDMEEAAALYGSWLEYARRDDGSIVIEGVGETGDGGFVVAEELHTALNPIDEDIVTMETGKNSTPTWVWIVIAILAAALVAVGLMWWCDRKPAVETVVTTTVVPEPAVVDSLAVVATEQSAAEAATAPTATAPAAAAVPVGPRYHVIAGAFSIESNADKFMTRVKREHPELTPEKIVNPANGLHMVSIFQSPNRRQVSGKMNLYWDVDLYLWVYEQK